MVVKANRFAFRKKSEVIKRDCSGESLLILSTVADVSNVLSGKRLQSRVF